MAEYEKSTQRDSFLQNGIELAIRYKIIIDFYLLFMVWETDIHGM